MATTKKKAKPKQKADVVANRDGALYERKGTSFRYMQANERRMKVGDNKHGVKRVGSK